jgi:predicted GNAT family acetyltransferase
MDSSSSSVEVVTELNRREVEEYLTSHEDTSQFLINNLREHGPKLTSHQNSGNFKVIRSNGRVSAVFCLARRGNLFVQASFDFSATILKACEEETIPLTGFIGDWASVSPVWDRFKRAHPGYKASYESKEILYTYLLRQEDSNLVHDLRVRFLEESDFEQWLAFETRYLSELGISDDRVTDQKRESFLRLVRDRLTWGLFVGDTLYSRTGLNSSGANIGQVGGVFTPEQHRKKGYARAAMFHMLKDCRDLHGHRKSILFTGEADIPAQRLYESMGYLRTGSFALILG